MMRDTVLIVGVGMMGPGIAACSSLAGHPTVLIGRSKQKAKAGLEKARSNIFQLQENQLAEKVQVDLALELLRAGTEIRQSLDEAFLIIEAISENLEEKQKLFQTLDSLASPEVLITSNTSGLRISDITRLTRHPQRTATTHFWFPGHLVPLVEIVMGAKTDEHTATQLQELFIRWKKTPVIVKKDLPGQLANRILQAIIREAINIVQMGLASPEDVDTAIKMGMALRFPVWGPLEHIDAVGLDLALSVQRDVLAGLNNSPSPPKYLQDLYDRGELGFKTGKGFYDWKTKNMNSLAETRDRFIMQALRILKTIL